MTSDGEAAAAPAVSHAATTHRPARPGLMRVCANSGLQMARYWLTASRRRARELAQRDRIIGTSRTTAMNRQ